MNNFTLTGIWFLPSNPERKLPGTLIYEKGNGIELILSAHFPELLSIVNENEEVIILGKSSFTTITLLECSNVAMNAGKVIYRARYLFKGKHFSDRASIKFHSIIARLNTLNEWSSSEVFNMVYKEDGYTINYKEKENIDFDINEKYEGYLSFVSDNPYNHTSNKITIKENAYVVIKSKNEDVKFDNFLEYLTTFQFFITLGTFKNSYPLEITFNYNDNGDILESINTPAIQFCSIYDYKKDLDLKPIERFLFTHNHIKDNFGGIIKTWFEKYEILRPVILMIISNIHDIDVFDTNKFLNIAQALETIHARIYKDAKMFDKKEFDKTCKSILDFVKKEHPEYVDLIRDRGISANELNLNKRLEQLIDNYKNEYLEKVISNKETFIIKTKQTRNYFTHYNIKDEKKALEGYELYKHTEKMKMLLYSVILIEAGFSKELTEQILKNNRNNRFFNIG